jgi:hypothetical protein
MNKKQSNEPHAKREENQITPEGMLATVRIASSGWLKNGNPPGNLSSVPKCGARSKRTGQPCRQPAMANGRCRLHGGKSTGPKTSQGLERTRKGNWKHGLYSA